MSNFTSDSTSGVSEGSDSGSHKVNQSVVTPAAPNSSMTAVTADTSMLGSDEPPAMQQYNMSQMSHSSTLPTLHEYSELDLETDNTTAPSLPVSLINSLPQASLNLTSKKRHQVNAVEIKIHQWPKIEFPLEARPSHLWSSLYNVLPTWET